MAPVRRRPDRPSRAGDLLERRPRVRPRGRARRRHVPDRGCDCRGAGGPVARRHPRCLVRGRGPRGHCATKRGSPCTGTPEQPSVKAVEMAALVGSPAAKLLLRDPSGDPDGLLVPRDGDRRRVGRADPFVRHSHDRDQRDRCHEGLDARRDLRASGRSTRGTWSRSATCRTIFRSWPGPATRTPWRTPIRRCWKRSSSTSRASTTTVSPRCSNASSRALVEVRAQRPPGNVHPVG